MERFNNILGKTKTKKSIFIIIILAVLVVTSVLLTLLLPNVNFAHVDDLDKEKINENSTILEEINEENTDKRSDYNEEVVKSAEIVSENLEETKKIVTAKYVDGFITPIQNGNYTVTCKFGKMADTVHTGIDLTAQSGTDIVSVASGTVLCSKYKGSYGYLVIIEHENGIKTYYAHCSNLYVNEGQTVSQGDVIAAVGATGNTTGPQLHFEIRDSNNIAKNPENYLKF